jgi:hypothetical protein
MKTLLLAVFIAAPAAAAPALTFEQSAGAVRAQLQAAFGRERSPLKLVVVSEEEGRRAKAAGVRSIRLSGQLSLDGSAHVSAGPFTTITLSGWAYLRDDNGGRISGNIHFSDTQTYHLSGNHVSGWARPYAYVNVYEGDKLLGTTRVDGSIYVSGWNNGGWVRVSGSGPVSGSLVVGD